MKRKGKIAPICVTVLLSIYYIAVLIAVILLKQIPGIARVCVVIFNSALVALLIFVLIRRIREIDGGEYDDLDRY